MTREEIKNIVRHVFHFYEVNAENCNWTDMNEACGEIFKALEQEPTTKNDLPHCQHTDEEIAKSFKEDVEAVKDLLPTTKNDLGIDYVSRQFMYELGATCIATRNENGELIALGAIEALPSVTPQEPRWIPVSERLPKEHEWIGTKTFGTTISEEVYVTFENSKGERFTEHLSFQNGKVSNFVQREIDAFHKGSVPIAWMPLPQPYEPQESEG